jgi:hypothetical protein
MEADAHHNLEDGHRPSEPEPIMDRRLTGDRRQGDRRKRGEPAPDAAANRRAGSDRRQQGRRKADAGAPARTARNINQYDMTKDELEFVDAVIRHRERNGNRFPKARDILQILRDLGYEKRTDG